MHETQQRRVLRMLHSRTVTGTLDVRYSFVSHVVMRDIIELLLTLICHLHIAGGPQRFVSHVVMRYIL